MTALRERAYRLVRTAVANSTLTRPPECSRCGALDTIHASGRHTIQAHHYRGYKNPLDVEWLCARCHRQDTPLPKKMGAPNFGERNGYAKLTQSQVDLIRSSDRSGASLAREFGVDRSCVNRIRRGEQWLAAAPEKEGEQP